MRQQFLLLALLRLCKLGLSLALLLVCARLFGVSLATDAWVFASSVVGALGLFVWGPVNEIARSRFLLQLGRYGLVEAAQAAAQLMWVTALVSVLLACVLWFCAPWLLSWLYQSTGSEADRLVLRVFALMLPSIVLSQVLALGTAFLNCCDMIYEPEWIGVFAALSSFVCLFALGSDVGIYALVAAHYVGLLVAVLGVLLLLWRKRFLDGLFQPVSGAAVIDYLRFSLPLYASYGAGQANVMLEKSLASSMGIGMVSSLNYASQIKSTLQAVVSSVLFSLAVPKLSRVLAMGGSTHEFTLAWLEVQRVVALLLLLVLAPVWGGADLIVAVLFDVAHVNGDQMALVADLIRWYVVALVPVSLYLVHGCALLAQQRGRSYAVWGVASQALSVLICLFFFDVWGPKVFPLALLVSHGLAAVAMAATVGSSGLLWRDLLVWLVLLFVTCESALVFAQWIALQVAPGFVALLMLCFSYAALLLLCFAAYRWWQRSRR
jgi:peptidoglycan biosynthesis protein MviN/MurJ (putative lipid II flippase)